MVWICNAEPCVSWPSVWSAKRACTSAAIESMGCEAIRNPPAALASIGVALDCSVETTNLSCDDGAASLGTGSMEVMFCSDGGRFILPV